MSGLPPGYDAWRTREPDHWRLDEEQIVWRLNGYSPHVDKPMDLGEFPSEAKAQQAGQNWIDEMEEEDPEYACDYWIDVREVDLLADCICYRRRERFCPVHGQDPDDARDDR